MLDSIALNLVLLIIYIVFFIIQLRKKTSFIYHLIYFLFFIYINGVLAITLFPLPIQKELIIDMEKDAYLKNSFIPFKDIIHIVDSKSLSMISKQIFGNIIMFMPLGFFMPLITNKVSTVKKILVIGLLMSVLIESLQSIISLIIGVQYKISSIDDVILNVIGALFGFVMFKIALPIIKNYLIKDKELSNKINGI